MAHLIAEFCQNHKGDRGLLREMICAAEESGATFAKIQTIFSDDLTRRERFETGAVAPDGTVKTIKRPYDVEYARLRALDLSPNDYAWFVEECRRVGIEPLTTIFTRGRVKEMAALGWTSVKVASYDCASLPLIRDLKDHFKNLIISTGATTDREIAATARELTGHTFSFLHCVTIYPTPLHEMHLNRMQWLRRFTPQVGLSEHSLVARDGIKASKAALALGADLIERHFTISPANETKDGPVSITPEQMKELSSFASLPPAERLRAAQEEIPEFEMLLGQERRELSYQELLNRDYYRGRFATHRDGQPLWNWDEGAS